MKIKKKIIISLLAALICAVRPCNAGGFEEFMWSHKGKALGLAVIAGAALVQEKYYGRQRQREPQPVPAPHEKSIEEQIIENMPDRVLTHRFIAEVEQRNPNISVLTKLADRRADVNAYNEQGLTPLLIALQEQTRNETVALKLLIDFHAYSNLAQHGTNITPLMAAVRKKYFQQGYKNDQDVVHALNEQGALLDAVDAQGKTAFEHALESYNLPAMQQLIEMGAPTGFELKCVEDGGYVTYVAPQKLDAFTVMARAYAAHQELFQDKNRLQEFEELATDMMYLLCENRGVYNNYFVINTEPNGEPTSFQLLARRHCLEALRGFPLIARELLHILQVNTPIIKMVFRAIKPEDSPESAALVEGIQSDLYEATQAIKSSPGSSNVSVNARLIDPQTGKEKSYKESIVLRPKLVWVLKPYVEGWPYIPGDNPKVRFYDGAPPKMTPIQEAELANKLQELEVNFQLLAKF